MLGTPASLLEAVARWAVLSVVSTFALVGIDRAARLLLPLTTLLQLSIVFSDQAPSRMKMALRQGTAKHLAHEVAVLEDATAQEAAEYLLRVVAELTAHDRLTRGHTERVRSGHVRHPRHVGGVVHLRQRGARLRVAQQGRDAAVGRLGALAGDQNADTADADVDEISALLMSDDTSVIRDRYASDDRLRVGTEVMLLTDTGEWGPSPVVELA